MVKKTSLLIILLLINTVVYAKWESQDGSLSNSSLEVIQAKMQQQLLQFNQKRLSSAQCRIDSTVCKSPSNSPNNTDFFYNGVLRTGYLNVDKKPGSALGFMFFGRRDTQQSNLKNYPTIIFLGGGPGMSSQFGNFREVGPLSLRKIFSPVIVLNNFTWARDANLLFIDQPVGTGISCLADSGHIPTKMDAIAADFLRAFNKIFTSDQGLKIDGCFSEKNLNIPATSSFYIFGEGYAGKYAAAFAQKILQQKRAGSSVIGLKGIAIGGGLNNPFKTLSQIGNYGFSMSLLDYQQRIREQKILLRASFNNQNKNWLGLKTDFERALSYLHERTGVSYYDITKDGFDQDLIQNFFGNKTNLARFAFQSSINFQTLSKQVYNALAADFMTNEISSLQSLLSSSFPVLIYQGQDDAYANPTGTMRWVQQLNFPYSVQFRDQNLRAWRVNGALYGTMKNSGSLTFMIVHNAGHYVAQDNPEAAYYMARDWIAANNK